MKGHLMLARILLYLNRKLNNPGLNGSHDFGCGSTSCNMEDVENPEFMEAYKKSLQNYLFISTGKFIYGVILKRMDY